MTKFLYRSCNHDSKCQPRIIQDQPSPNKSHTRIRNDSKGQNKIQTRVKHDSAKTEHAGGNNSLFVTLGSLFPKPQSCEGSQGNNEHVTMGECNNNSNNNKIITSNLQQDLKSLVEIKFYTSILTSLQFRGGRCISCQYYWRKM